MQRSNHIIILALLSPLFLLLNLFCIEDAEVKLLQPNTLRKITSNLPFYSNTNPTTLNYVALGTSVTWGQGLDNRETQSYIKLLSRNSLNLAIRASDATYASLCTQSLLGDNVYNVIIIEYERRYEDGLELLVKRLRQRYPNAIIIVTDIWTFMNVYVIQNNDKNNIIPFVSWLKSNGINKNEQEAYNFVSKSKERFIFSKMLFDRSEYLNTLGKKYNLQVYSWDKSHDEMDVRDLMLRYLPMYHRDFIHLSVYGHEHTAENMRGIVDGVMKRRKSFFYPSTSMDALGTWGDGDFCSFWVENGIIPDTTDASHYVTTPSLQYDNSKVSMVEFDKWKHKYALQFPYNSDYEIQIKNPFNESRILSFTYMATGPNSTIYPLTQVTISSSDDEIITRSSKDKAILDLVNKWEDVNHDKKSIIIHPIVNTYNYPVHVQLTTTIGKVKPGANVVQVEPMEISNEPFRLVGFAITNNDFILSKIFERASSLAEEEEIKNGLIESRL